MSVYLGRGIFHRSLLRLIIIYSDFKDLSILLNKDLYAYFDDDQKTFNFLIASALLKE